MFLSAATRADGRSAPGPAAGRRLAATLGPAFVAAIAYVDPGNVATNLAGGAQYGYTLVWVVVGANLLAMLVQYLAAKIGLATGRDLSRLCREHLPGPVTLGLWVQGEAVAIATDLAEFVGAALALQLLIGLPPLPAGIASAAVTLAVLQLRRRGRRPFELAIVGLLAMVALSFGYELLLAPPSAAGVAGGLVPRFAGPSSMLLASGIVGATVMPHAVYVHSQLTAPLGRAARDDRSRRRVLTGQKLDVLLALALAGAVNVAMLLLAAVALRTSGGRPPTVPVAHEQLVSQFGALAGLVFAVGLLASGLSSCAVGTCAGEIVMQGFLGRRLPVLLRRTVTMAPALALLAAGTDPTWVLVVSQVVLSVGLPFTLVPLLVLTSRPSVMGALVNRPGTVVAGVLVTTAVLAMNGLLLTRVLTG